LTLARLETSTITEFKKVRVGPSITTATVASEQIRKSRAKPLRGAEGALDFLICSEKRVAVAIDGIFRTFT
jgi:hypothetical protein